MSNDMEELVTVATQQRETEDEVLDKKKVHIRVQQRKGNKCVTSVQGLRQDLNFDRVCRAFQKEYGCNGQVIHSGDAGTVLVFQGKWGEKAKDFILLHRFAKPDNLEIHSL